MFIFKHIRIYVYIYLYMYIYLNTNTYMHIYICIYTYLFINIYTYIPVDTTRGRNGSFLFKKEIFFPYVDTNVGLRSAPVK
jgi:hypothetical protein